MQQIYKLALEAEEQLECCCTALCDKEIVKKSVEKTGRLIISHEAPITGGFAGEISSKIHEECFNVLKKPIKRVCGWDIPFPYIFENLYLPGITRCFNSIKEICTK